MKSIVRTAALAILLFGLLCLFPHHTYAWAHSYNSYTDNPPGFFYGLWHGFISPFAVFAQLFDHSIILYASPNSGFGYNIGFLIGFSSIVGGGSAASNKS